MNCRKPGTTRSSAGCSATTASATAPCSSIPPGLRCVLMSGWRRRVATARTVICAGCWSRSCATMRSRCRTAICRVIFNGCRRSSARRCLTGSAKDPELTVEVFVSVLYRNKGAYLIGRIFTCDEQWPLAIPLLHRDGQGIVADALITDEAEVSIIFSFTRSYFMVEVPILPSSSAFSSASCPAAHRRAVQLDRLLQAWQVRVLPRTDRPPGQYR